MKLFQHTSDLEVLSKCFSTKRRPTAKLIVSLADKEQEMSLRCSLEVPRSTCRNNTAKFLHLIINGAFGKHVTTIVF